MRRLAGKIEPSMFHRRLILLVLVAFGVAGVMSAQMARLTLAKGSAMRVESEAALVEGTLIPTIRGRILDRKQRVVALDRPSNDVAVKYSVITGDWAYLAARKAVQKEEGPRWAELGYEEREKLIEKGRGLFDEQIDDLWLALCQIG